MSMAATLCFSLFILLSSLFLAASQSQYVPTHFFINCGSNSDIDFTGQTFVGDEKPSTFSVDGGRAAVENNRSASSTPPIYRTARVFSKKSGYELQADENNTFVMVRLHFFRFSSNEFDSSTPQFDVSISGFPLLKGFVVGDLNTTVVKEFIIPIQSELRFRIEFEPSGGSNSAFVNAIEAFTTRPDLFTKDVSLPHASPAGNMDSFDKSATDYAFNPIYRINVGGNPIDMSRDTLRRNWEPDDPFIFNSAPARNRSSDLQINYENGGANPYHAPNDVYRTAKELNNSQVNLTWIFPVEKQRTFLVRAHFCDIVSIGLIDPSFAFNFFIYSLSKEEIKPIDYNRLLVPFFHDFVVDSSDLGSLNVSIGAIRGNDQPVLLNGLEIFELLKNSGSGYRPNGGKNSKTLYIVIGCVAGGVVLLSVLFAGFFFGSRYGKAKTIVTSKPDSQAVPSYGRSSYTSINMDFTINHPSPIPNLNLNLRIPFSDLVQATNGFDEKLMIGQGGFGKVYKGTLPDGMKVAVKRAEKGHGQGRPEFVTEITVLSKIRHRHLVSLIGYCDEKSEMILVYEFMEKGTLQDHLYGPNEAHPKLSWKQRVDICINATHGLHYLHTGSDGGIIHRDVKSTNILLNEHYVAKVADFGISRLENEYQSEISDVKGSFGYLDPEYINCMKLTQKSDVYSFGVVLLEALCARPALNPQLPRNEMNLAEWGIRMIKNGKSETIIDPFLEGTINPNSLRKFLETVERCLKDTGDERPNMIDVLWDLEYVLKLQQTSTETDPYDDSTMNTSLQLPMSMIYRLPSHITDETEVNDSSASSFPSESQVFSQLNMNDAR